MKISILLPYKENYTFGQAGAVSLFVNDITKYSSYQKNIKIFGNTKYKNFLSKNYINLSFDKKIFSSSNKQYVKNFIENKNSINSDLIEVHNRPSYMNIIKDKYFNKIFLYFHNDPLQMNGSRTTQERLDLLKNIDKILFNSEWCRNRFFINLDDKKNLIDKTEIFSPNISTRSPSLTFKLVTSIVKVPMLIFPIILQYLLFKYTLPTPLLSLLFNPSA